MLAYLAIDQLSTETTATTKMFTFLTPRCFENILISKQVLNIIISKI